MQSAVVKNATIVDPRSGDVTENSAILIVDGMIANIVSGESEPLGPDDVVAGAQEIDFAGLWAIPGMIDSHVHVDTIAGAQSALSRGATTLRSASTTFFQDVALARLAEENPGCLPRIVPAGLFVAPEERDIVLADPELLPLFGQDDALFDPGNLRKIVHVNFAHGARVIKTRSNFRAGLPDQDPLAPAYRFAELAEVVDAAEECGGHVLCHAYTEIGCDEAVRAGVRSLEHGVFVSTDTLRAMKERNTFFTPTLTALAGSMDSEFEVVRDRGRRFLPVLREAVGNAVDMGVKLLCGTDSGGGRGIGEEAAMVGECGVPPLEVLRALTTYPAEILGLESEMGEIRVGHRGDLVGLRSNPLASSSAFLEVDTVVAAGSLVPR